MLFCFVQVIRANGQHWSSDRWKPHRTYRDPSFPNSFDPNIMLKKKKLQEEKNQNKDQEEMAFKKAYEFPMEVGFPDGDDEKRNYSRKN